MTGRILVGCLGNRLRSDDGVGPAVGDYLERRGVPAHVRIEEVGIGGIHLVQSLLEPGYEALIVVDCVDRGRAPGTVMVIQPEVLDVRSLGDIDKYDYLADMHYTNPERAFALARALGVLPDRFVLVGVQPEDAETLEQRLSEPVARAVEVAAAEIVSLIGQYARDG